MPIRVDSTPQVERPAEKRKDLDAKRAQAVREARSVKKTKNARVESSRKTKPRSDTFNRKEATAKGSTSNTLRKTNQAISMALGADQSLQDMAGFVVELGKLAEKATEVKGDERKQLDKKFTEVREQVKVQIKKVDKQVTQQVAQERAPQRREGPTPLSTAIDNLNDQNVVTANDAKSATAAIDRAQEAIVEQREVIGTNITQLSKVANRLTERLHTAGAERPKRGETAEQASENARRQTVRRPSEALNSQANLRPAVVLNLLD